MSPLFHFINSGFELYPAIKDTGAPIFKYTKESGIKNPDELKKYLSKDFSRFVCVPGRNEKITLDIDVKGNRNGKQSLIDYCNSKGLNYKDVFKNTPHTKTPGGGVHLYYGYTGEPVLNNEILPGVEVKYSNLITAPGSESHKGKYFFCGDISNCKELPSFLKALLLPRYPQQQERNYNNISSDISLAKIESILFSQGHTPTPGGRNRYAFKFATFAAKQGKHRDTVIEYLLKYHSPDFPVYEIKNAVRSAFQIRGIN